MLAPCLLGCVDMCIPMLTSLGICVSPDTSLKITLLNKIVCWIVFRKYEKDMLKGAEVIFGERYGLVMHCLHSSSLLYIVWYG